jgi:hypothetical protein
VYFEIQLYCKTNVVIVGNSFTQEIFLILYPSKAVNNLSEPQDSEWIIAPLLKTTD